MCALYGAMCAAFTMVYALGIVEALWRPTGLKLVCEATFEPGVEAYLAMGIQW